MSTPNEEDDFLEGFDDTTIDNPSDTPPGGNELIVDETPPADNTQAQSTSPAPKAASTDEPVEEADPFEGLPKAARELLASVPMMRTELETLRRQAGMVPALQSKIDRLEQGRTTAPPAGATQPNAPRFEKVEKLRGELPDIAEALDEIANALTPMPKASTVANEAPPSATPTTESDPAIEALDGVRPSWSEDLFSTECQLWMSQLPAERQQEIRSTNKPGVILKFLNEFDGFKARTAQTRQTQTDRTRRMGAAVAPRGDGRTTRSLAPVDDEDADMEAGFYGNQRR